MTDPPPSPSSSSAATSSSSAAPRSRSSTANRHAITPVLQFWKAFDLDSKRLVLDTQGSAMKTEKESSVRSRKKLAETTKTFRKLPDSDKLAAIQPLLRAYQEEIDSLTKRAKFADNAFFMLYKGLYAAPDPVAVLEAAADARVSADARISELDALNNRLTRELSQYRAELATLTDQAITIRRLEDHVRAFEHDMDALVHARVVAQTNELEAQVAACHSELIEVQQMHAQQLAASRDELRHANSRLDAMQTDLFASRQQSGRVRTARDAELELMANDAVVLQTLQLENARLKSQLDALLRDSAISTSSHVDPPTMASSVSEIAARDATIQRLRNELVGMQQQMTQTQAAAAADYSTLETQLAAAQQMTQTLELELAKRPTAEAHADAIHQLHVLQQLEFNIVDEDGNDDVNTAIDHVITEHTSVEKILVARVRRLEHALQQCERQAQQTSDELTQSREALTQSNAVVADQTALLRSLEEHVAALESRKRILKPSHDVGAELLLDAVEHDDAIYTSSIDNTNAGATDSKMLEIVRSQRDRFRERMKELERETNRLEDAAAKGRAAVARLETDNMQLYHKIRFLQSYRTGSNVGSNSTGVSQLEAGGNTTDAVEATYRRQYEEKLNPFVQFNRMETQQRIANLNAVDKVLLTSARMFLGHRVTRSIAFAYIVLLHFLVFATLYSFLHGCGVSND